MLQDIFRSVFGSRGGIALHTPSLVVAPGAVIPVQIRFEALELPRDVAFLRLHLQMTVHQWTTGVVGPQIEAQTRDVISPIMVSERFVVAAGMRQDFAVNVSIPQGLYPSMPGQIDYALWAVAPVAGQTIDSAMHLPLTLIGAVPGMAVASQAAPVAAPITQPVVAPPPFAAGQDVQALGADGAWLAAMVVEVRGPVVFVQWSDGRPAMWVRAENVRVPPTP
jgi:hypothetical protein